MHFDKSTKPNSDNKIIVNSGTLIKHLRTTDSSEFCNGTRTREFSDKKLSKPSPFLRMRDKKCSSQINLKPKLKIVKSKEPKKVYMKNIKNPFKKGRKKDFDYSSKISGISPNSRLKTSEIYKDKKGRKKGSQKRSTSYISNKSQGRSKNSLPDEGKCIKAFLSNYYSKNSRKSHKNSMKNLINKEAIVSYKDVAKNLEIIKKIERKIKDKDFKNLKNLVKDSEAEAFLISARKDSKQKTSFHRPSLSA